MRDERKEEYGFQKKSQEKIYKIREDAVVGVERDVAGVNETGQKCFIHTAPDLVLKLFLIDGIAGRVETADGIAVKEVP